MLSDEKAANIPLMFFNSVVTRDSRKMIISTQPVSFMMQGWQDTTRIPVMDPDAIDFASFFAKQDPYNLRMLDSYADECHFPDCITQCVAAFQPGDRCNGCRSAG